MPIPVTPALESIAPLQHTPIAPAATVILLGPDGHSPGPISVHVGDAVEWRAVTTVQARAFALSGEPRLRTAAAALLLRSEAAHGDARMGNERFVTLRRRGGGGQMTVKGWKFL